MGVGVRDMVVGVGGMGVGVRGMGMGVGDRDSFPHSGIFDLDVFARFLRRINASVALTTEENLLRRNPVCCARNMAASV